MQPKSETEYAFTLIELLVIIVIIGILASIAIPVFLNQRQRANDAAVQSDVKNAIAVVDYNLALYTNADGAWQNNNRVVTASREEVSLSPGVRLAIHANGGYYCITAFHENGKQFNSRTQALTYKNIPTGGGWNAGCESVPALDRFLVG